MGEIPRILVGLAMGPLPDRRFFESLPLFAKQVSERGIADLTFFWVWNKPLVDAQNEFAEKMLSEDFNYLLTIEDDHHGFNADMLKALLSQDAEVVSISYRSRHFPFYKIPMHGSSTPEIRSKKFFGSNHVEGFHEADLSGFGFTLIRKDVFTRLEKPVFRLNIDNYDSAGPRATDIDFCNRLQEAGGKIIGCYDYILPHRDLEESVYKEMLVDGILARHSMFTRLHSMMTENKKYKEILCKV
jgi:hypothetical protein